MNSLSIKKYFIAYFDVLGYKDYISSNSKLLHLAQTIRKYLGFINTRNEKAEKLDDEYAYKFKCFSDNFLLCTEKHDQGLIESIAWLQFNLALDNVFVRGSFSFGELHVDKDFVFGKGIVKAHDIESKIAIFPRVVVDNTYTIATHFADSCDTSKIGMEYIGPIKADFDGVNFIDYLDVVKVKYDIKHWKFENGLRAELETHKRNIMENVTKYSKQDNPVVLQKYMWLKNYHNSFCNKHGFCDIVI